ncbi:ABC transporter ATP-binding protein, partial [Synechocystis sp. LEGE 06083]|uniref:ABC transporter ATP-binding protein n=1 Tax=Synechocystis sp. LEGE 06083 TaxID=915336 RepID=UPI0018825CC5
PELTGRENIYLNGAILGMTRAEIKKKFDEIVDFAEVERFLDTPVKRYSSGMYVRLAFAVAAHLEPEILVVDEVLAVGDAAFQKKCLGKMGEVAEKEGRTVLFVSHNMTAIDRLCSRSQFLQEGYIKYDGHTSESISNYLKSIQDYNQTGEIKWDDITTAPGSEKVRLHLVKLQNNHKMGNTIPIDQDLKIEVQFWVLDNNISSLYVDIYIYDSMGSVVLSTPSTQKANAIRDPFYENGFSKGLFCSICTIPKNFLNDIQYYVSVFIVNLEHLNIEVTAEKILNFGVFDTGEMLENGGGKWAGLIRTRMAWQTKMISDLP